MRAGAPVHTYTPTHTCTEEDPEAALEARLARLREAKGATPYNKGAKSEGGKPKNVESGRHSTSNLLTTECAPSPKSAPG